MLVPLNENPNQNIHLEIETLGEFDKPIYPVCYITGRSQIDVVCHHCGRAINLDETPALRDNRYRHRLAKKLKRQKNRKPFLQKTIRLLNKYLLFRDQEFSDIGLEKDSAIHCEYCQHQISKTFIFLAMLLVAYVFLLGIAFLQLISFAAFVFLTLLWGTAAAFLVFFGLQMNEAATSVATQPFPLIGRAATVDIKEHQKGEIELTSDGQYIGRTKIDSCCGVLKYSLLLSQSDEHRFHKYLEKYKISNHNSFQFLASFLLFNNLRPVLFVNQHHLISDRDNTLYIRGGGTVNSWSKKIKEPIWNTDQQYTYKIVIDPQDETSITPIQVFPTIISEGDRTALEFTVQVNPNIWNKNFLKEDITIKEFSIESDSEIQLGEVIAAHPPHFPQDKKSQVTWKKIKLVPPSKEAFDEGLDESQLDSQDQLLPTAQFYVRFESNVLTNNRLKGTIVAQFKETLSGIDDLQIFDPLGYKVDEQKLSVKRQTESTLNLSLSLERLSIREHFSPQIPPTEKPVKPNSQLVNKLIEEIIGDGRTYIQRVIENPPQTNRANAKIINRFWDIAGRQYIGVYPIDFHLVLIGSEIYSDKDVSDAGNTKFEVKVSATITNDDMKQKAEALQSRLLYIIDSVSSSL